MRDARFLMRFIGISLVFGGSSLLAETICGPEWLANLPAVEGSVYGVTTWDPDGDGPNPPLLIAGGSFSMAGGVPASNIAAFDGTSWFPLGEGVNEIPWAFTEYEGDLVVGGRFTMAGGAPANYVARWDGTSWSPLGNGLSMFVYALAVYNGELYAGGWFIVDGTRSIARWDGANWVPVGTGMAVEGCPGCGTGVYALAPFNGELVAGGYFTQAGSVWAPHVASWNGSRWTYLSGGFNNQVEALGLYNGQLIAGGRFTKANAVVTTNYIARWTGTAWAGMGGGMSGAVGALTVNNGQLFAGGWFTAAGGSPANYIAQWNGASWSPLGSGMDSLVLGLTSYDGDVVAGGHFLTAGGVDSLRWARWRHVPPPQIGTPPGHLTIPYGEDANFSVVATGTGPLQYAWRKGALPLDEGGRFSGTATANLTIFQPTRADQGLYSVVVTDDCHSTTSAAASLTVMCPGSITSSPSNQSAPVGTDVHFAVEAVDGAGEFQYTWRRNGVPLVEGGQISGSNSPNLTISQVGMSNQGVYSVVVTDDCGSMTSGGASLNVSCPGYVMADLDRDCDVDADDLAIFQACAAGAGLPARPGCPTWPNNRNRPVADLDGDGDVDMDDFGILQRCYSGRNVPADTTCPGL